MTTSIAPTNKKRDELQQAHTTRYARMAENTAIGALISVLVGACGFFGLFIHDLVIWSACLFAAGVLGTGILGTMSASASKRRNAQVYVPRSTPLDVAIRAVADFLFAYKEPLRDEVELHEAARLMVARLREVSTEPLTGIKRTGYRPFGDTYEREGLEFQWDMVESAICELLPMYEGKTQATCDDVQARIARMVPPLRNILGRIPTFIPEIEYGGYNPEALVAPTGRQQKTIRKAAQSVLADLTPATGRVSPPASTPDDLFTPVERDINAAATMLVATLRTQIAAFQTADPTLFAGADRQSGQLLVDMHLPNLLRAYRTAHDVSQGEERDDVRSQFAGTLRTVRDSLDQIMTRHAAEARAALDTETRFLESRAERSELDPA